MGRWNVPSRTAQFMGYGNGAGNHAPMVRNIHSKPPRVPRVAFVPLRQEGAPRLAGITSRLPRFDHDATVSAPCNGQPCVTQADSWNEPQDCGYQQQGPLTPTLASPQDLFSAPAAPNVPPTPTPDAKKQARPRLPAKSQRSVEPPKAEGLPNPQTPTQEPAEESLPKPPMPTADPLVEPDYQAWRNW